MLNATGLSYRLSDLVLNFNMVNTGEEEDVLDLHKVTGRKNQFSVSYKFLHIHVTNDFSVLL